MSPLPRVWIPIADGELNCCCCGTHWAGELAWCKKHAFCAICIGREHDEDHDQAECDDMEPEALAKPFRRMEHDCAHCSHPDGPRHMDWETCAKKWMEETP